MMNKEEVNDKDELIKSLQAEIEKLKKPLYLYIVKNGWETHDGGGCHAHVIAYSEEEALKLCIDDFKEHAEIVWEDETFWNNLTVELVELDEDIKRDGISLGLNYY